MIAARSDHWMLHLRTREWQSFSTKHLQHFSHPKTKIELNSQWNRPSWRYILLDKHHQQIKKCQQIMQLQELTQEFRVRFRGSMFPDVRLAWWRWYHQSSDSIILLIRSKKNATPPCWPLHNASRHSITILSTRCLVSITSRPGQWSVLLKSHPRW